MGRPVQLRIKEVPKSVNNCFFLMGTSRGNPI